MARFNLYVLYFFNAEHTKSARRAFPAARVSDVAGSEAKHRDDDADDGLARISGAKHREVPNALWRITAGHARRHAGPAVAESSASSCPHAREVGIGGSESAGGPGSEGGRDPRCRITGSRDQGGRLMGMYRWQGTRVRDHMCGRGKPRDPRRMRLSSQPESHISARRGVCQKSVILRDSKPWRSLSRRSEPARPHTQGRGTGSCALPDPASPEPVQQ